MPDGPANDGPEPMELKLPTDFKAMVLVGIFSLLFLYALYITGEILVPVIIAFLLKMVLQPATEMLVTFHFPRFLAALLVVGVLLGGVSGLAVFLAGPAAGWISDAPKNLAKIERHLDGVSAFARDLKQASKDVEKLGDDATTPAVAVKGPPLSTFLFSGTRALVTGLLTIVLLLFFLLVSGNSFLRRIVEILPTLHDKKQAVEIINEIQRTIAVYLGTVTMMNVAVGILTGVTAYFCGLTDPVLWGSAAFLLNYIPILGPMAAAILLALVGLTTFDGSVAGAVACRHFPADPSRRSRCDHADVAGPAVHAQSRRGDHSPDLLVLDVGSRRRFTRGAHGRDIQDHLRPHRDVEGDRSLPWHGTARHA